MNVAAGAPFTASVKVWVPRLEPNPVNQMNVAGPAGAGAVRQTMLLVPSVARAMRASRAAASGEAYVMVAPATVDALHTGAGVSGGVSGSRAQSLTNRLWESLSANVYVPGRRTFLTQPYTIIENRGHRVGVIGLTGGPAVSVAEEPGKTETGSLVEDQTLERDAAVALYWDELVVLNPRGAPQRSLDKVRDMADIIVVLSSLGWQENLRLADGASGVDRPAQRCSGRGGWSAHVWDG